MFENYTIIQTYIYLEILFFSLTLALICDKIGYEVIKILIRGLITQLKNWR